MPTVGSVVIINVAEVIQLTEAFYAPRSLGSFSLQIAVTVVNNQAEAWNAGNWELFIVPMNSGIFVNERGTSSVYTALLTKADVAQDLETQHYSHGAAKRMIGGSFLNSLKSAMGWISSKLPAVRNALGHIDHPHAKVGHSFLKKMGYGKPRGADKLENRRVLRNVNT